MNSQTYILWPDHPEIKHNLIRCINTLDTSKAWEFKFEEYQKPKTFSQRGWWHKLLELWGAEIGLTKGQTKEIVKGFHFGWKEVQIAGIKFMAADGSSEDEKRLGYSNLIETTYRLAAEMGVVLPDADPLKGRKYRQAG